MGAFYIAKGFNPGEVEIRTDRIATVIFAQNRDNADARFTRYLNLGEYDTKVTLAVEPTSFIKALEIMTAPTVQLWSAGEGEPFRLTGGDFEHYFAPLVSLL